MGSREGAISSCLELFVLPWAHQVHSHIARRPSEAVELRLIPAPKQSNYRWYQPITVRSGWGTKGNTGEEYELRLQGSVSEEWFWGKPPSKACCHHKLVIMRSNPVLITLRSCGSQPRNNGRGFHVLHPVTGNPCVSTWRTSGVPYPCFDTPRDS